MSHQTPTDIDPKLVEAANAHWVAFTQAAKYSSIVIAIILIVMAFAFTDI